MRFLDLAIEDCVPDARTIWLFREHFKEFKLVEKLFADFDRYLAERGFETKKVKLLMLLSWQLQNNAVAERKTNR